MVAGINRRCRLAIETFERAVAKASELGVTDFVVCGDLFDTANPNPQILAAVGLVFLQHGAMDFHLLLGNHDMRSNVPGDHALGLLGLMANVRVYDRPEEVVLDSSEPGGSIHLAMLPFHPGGPMTGALEAFASTLGSGATHRILCMHAGIIDKSTPPWLRESSEGVSEALIARLIRVDSFSILWAGNWHWSLTGRGWQQIGALVPTGWDNAGSNYGQMATADYRGQASQGGLHRGYGIPGPSFHTVGPIGGVGYVPDSATHEEVLRTQGGRLPWMFLRVTYLPGYAEVAQAQAELVRKTGAYEAVITEPVEPPKATATNNTAEHLARAVSGNNLEAAVRAYLAAKPRSPNTAKIEQRALDVLRSRGV